jgi:bifunctional non-homologous end joining protein LigD
VQLLSRPSNLFNASFRDIVAAVAAVPGDFTWDAELTVDDAGGHPVFERLKSRAATSVPSRVKAAAARHPARLYVFDILSPGEHDLRGLPLLTRIAILRDMFEALGTLVFVNGIVGASEWVFARRGAEPARVPLGRQ